MLSFMRSTVVKRLLAVSVVALLLLLSFPAAAFADTPTPPPTPTPNGTSGCYEFHTIDSWHWDGVLPPHVEFDEHAVNFDGYGTVSLWWYDGPYAIVGDFYHWVVNVHQTGSTFPDGRLYGDVDTESSTFPISLFDLGGGWGRIDQHTSNMSVGSTNTADYWLEMCPPATPTATPTVTPTAGTATPTVSVPPGCSRYSGGFDFESHHYTVDGGVTGLFPGWSGRVINTPDSAAIVSAIAYNGSSELWHIALGETQGVIVPAAPIVLVYTSSTSFQVDFCPPAGTATPTVVPSPTVPPGPGQCTTWNDLLVYSSVSSGPFNDISYLVNGSDARFDVFFTFSEPSPSVESLFGIVSGPSATNFVFRYNVYWPSPFHSPASASVSFGSPASGLWHFHVVADHTDVIGKRVNVRFCQTAPTATPTLTQSPTRTATATSAASPSPSATATIDLSATPTNVPTLTPYAPGTATPVPTVVPTAIVASFCDKEPCYSYTKLSGAFGTFISGLRDKQAQASNCHTLFSIPIDAGPFAIPTPPIGDGFCWFVDRTEQIRAITRLVSVALFGLGLYKYFIWTMRRIGDV